MNFDIIENKRIDKNLSVTRLCELAGIDRGTYYHAMENPDSLRFLTASKLVEALKLNASERSQLFS